VTGDASVRQNRERAGKYLNGDESPTIWRSIFAARIDFFTRFFPRDREPDLLTS